MADEPPKPVETSRRSVLGALGATVGALSLSGNALAFGRHRAGRGRDRGRNRGRGQDRGKDRGKDRGRDQDRGRGRRQIVLRQGDRCVQVEPFTGEEPVEDFYEYRLPERYASETNGGVDPGSGPYYSSLGTTGLQRDGESLLFFYDGPNGLSLVILHGSLDGGPSGGGSVTFEIDGLPDDGSWVVRDDYYVDPDTGEIASHNYDNWDLDRDPQVVDWTWDDGRTDGGAFRGLDDRFDVTIDPAFNEEATLHGEHYDGTVESWQLLVPDDGGAQRTSLDLATPVTVETGSCEDGRGEDDRGDDREDDRDDDWWDDLWDDDRDEADDGGPPENRGPPGHAGPGDDDQKTGRSGDEGGDSGEDGWLWDRDNSRKDGWLRDLDGWLDD